MPSRGPGPHRIKGNRTYDVAELARCLGVSRNTVRNWQAKGLAPIDRLRPMLFNGADVRDFLALMRANRQRPCPPGTLYCFRCRQPRAPAANTAHFVATQPGTGDLRALCGDCGTAMHRRTREADLAAKLPGIPVQIRQGLSRLSGCPEPLLNCALKG